MPQYFSGLERDLADAGLAHHAGAFVEPAAMELQALREGVGVMRKGVDDARGVARRFGAGYGEGDEQKSDHYLCMVANNGAGSGLAPGATSKDEAVFLVF